MTTTFVNSVRPGTTVSRKIILKKTFVVFNMIKIMFTNKKPVTLYSGGSMVERRNDYLGFSLYPKIARIFS